MSKLRLLIAFALGYVAGAAAGRQRYEEIKAGAQRVAGNPRVQAAAAKAQETVAQQAPVVAEAVRKQATSAASAVAEKVTSSGDDGQHAARPEGADGGPALS